MDPKLGVIGSTEITCDAMELDAAADRYYGGAVDVSVIARIDGSLDEPVIRYGHPGGYPHHYVLLEAMGKKFDNRILLVSVDERTIHGNVASPCVSLQPNPATRARLLDNMEEYYRMVCEAMMEFIGPDQPK